MASNKQPYSVSRRGFLKKSLYSAPAVVALGHLTPSMVHGADSGFVETSPTVQVLEENNRVTGARAPGRGRGNGAAAGGGQGSQQGGSSGDGQNQSGDANADANVEEDEKKKKKGNQNGKNK